LGNISLFIDLVISETLLSVNSWWILRLCRYETVIHSIDTVIRGNLW